MIYDDSAIAVRRSRVLAEALETYDLGIALCRARRITASERWMTANTATQLFALGLLDDRCAIVEGTADAPAEPTTRSGSPSLEHRGERASDPWAGRLMAGVPDSSRPMPGDHRGERSARLRVATHLALGSRAARGGDRCS